jgi:hypothetical protein
MSTLSFFRQSVICTTERTCYQVVSAKLMAESATDVGKEIFSWRLRKGNLAGRMSAYIFWYAREAWKNGGSPTTPDGILPLLKAYLDDPSRLAVEDEPLNSQKSEQGQ